MKSPREKLKYERVLITLPKPLVGKLQKYAKSFKGGNKSGFVADAIEEKIEHLHKVRHTEKMRESYKAAASRNKKIMEEWQYADAEMVNDLDKMDSN